MPITETQLREVRQRLANVQSKRARALVERDNAQAKVAQSKETLQSQFGVVTNDEAKAKLAELTQNLDDTVATVREKLTEAGA